MNDADLDADLNLVTSAVVAYAEEQDASGLEAENVAEAAERLASWFLASAGESIDPDLLSALGWLDWYRDEVFGDPSALGRARVMFTILFQAEPERVPDELIEELVAADRSGNPAEALQQARGVVSLAVGTGDPALLERAVELGEAALGMSHADARLPLIGDLIAVYGTRFQVTGNLADLNRAIELAAEPAKVSDARWQLNLANVWYLRYQVAEDEESFDAVIQAASLAREHAAEPALREMADGFVAMMRQLRFTRSGGREDLDELVTALRAVQTAEPAEHATALSAVATAPRIRFQRLGAVEDLLESIDTARQAVAELSEPWGPREAEVLSVLGASLQIRFEALGRVADLDEAISVTEDAVAAYPPDSPHSASCLSNLSNARRFRYEAARDPDDLTAALSASRRAVAFTDEDNPNLPTYLNNLSIALQLRARDGGTLADLEEALEVAAAALEHTHPGSAEEDRLLQTMAIGVQLRAVHARDHEDGDFDAANAFGETITQRLTPSQVNVLREYYRR